MTSFTHFFTKRWIGFFLLYVVVWYPINTTLISVYEIVRQPALMYAASAFTIMYWLFISYMYFRRARNDWTARFVVGFSWLVLLLLFVSALAQPVLGLSWKSIFNIYTLLGGVPVNFLAIVVGAILAPHHSADRLLARSRAALRPSSDQPRQEQE